MRLIINNILSEDDKNTLLRATNGEIIPSFDLSDIAKLRESLSAYDRQFFDCLAFLIANNRIEILVIEPKRGRGISHTKSGVFFDGKNYVAFNGSCNFTKTALLDNIESVDAYCDWDGGVFVAKIDNINQEFEQLKSGNGIDHNWVLNTQGDVTKVCATLESPKTGIVLDVYTNEPGIQVYCGNFLDGTLTGKKGIVYNFRAAVCLETDKYPDTPNKPEWPSAVLRPGEKYQSQCIYKFSVHK